jgi:hypothetical protein
MHRTVSTSAALKRVVTPDKTMQNEQPTNCSHAFCLRVNRKAFPLLSRQKVFLPFRLLRQV